MDFIFLYSAYKASNKLPSMISMMDYDTASSSSSMWGLIHTRAFRPQFPPKNLRERRPDEADVAKSGSCGRNQRNTASLQRKGQFMEPSQRKQTRQQQELPRGRSIYFAGFTAPVNSFFKTPRQEVPADSSIPVFELSRQPTLERKKRRERKNQSRRNRWIKKTLTSGAPVSP